MKLEHTTGCICNSLNIDGVETIDMSKKELLHIIQVALERCDDMSIAQDVIALLIDEMGIQECSEEPCEECGDYIITNTLII